MPAEGYLIVEQQSSPAPKMPELLKELTVRYKLAGYDCRQRLLGQGEALLTKGSSEQLSEIKQTLAAHNQRSYVIVPSRLRFAPFLLSRIEGSDNELGLIGRKNQLIIPRNSRLLILLAELSGSLAERSLSQILSAHRYRGTTENSALPQQKLQRAILQGQPVLDIYLLDERGAPAAAVRAFPGKFDYRGLGERATLSANQNLLKLSELAQEYAAHCRVDMRFGLSPLPNATLQPANKEDLDGLKKNLRNLTRYAWLQTDIDTQRGPVKEDSAPDPVAMLAAGLLATGQSGLATNIPLQQKIVAELSAELAEPTTDSAPGVSPATLPQTLPTPPAAQHHHLWNTPRTLVGVILVLLVAGLTHFGHHSGWFGPLAIKALSSGTISGLMATGLLIGGFRLLQLKRLIQNTPTSKIRSIAMGRVELRGAARRQYALFSPMTDIACIYYRLTKYKRSQNNNWVVSSITSSGHVSFWLEDETGRVSVDPSAAKVKAAHRQENSCGGAVTFGGFSSSDEKWAEEMIYDGALIYVLGEAQVKKNLHPGRKQRRAEALQRIKQDACKRTSYDRNGDGRIDEEEWQAARDDVDDQLTREDLVDSAKRKRQEEQVVISKPRYGGPFVIAETASEAKLTDRYALAMGLLFTSAGLCGLLTLWLLLYQ